jgi:IstB-like ATP binding protein
MPNEGLGNGQPALTRHYKRLLAGADALGGAGALERTAGPGPDLSEGAVDERMGATRAELHRIVKEFLGDKPELHEIADKIASDGKTAWSKVMTLAAIDRLVHHSTILEMNVESYRRRAALDRKRRRGRAPTHATIKDKD